MLGTEPVLAQPMSVAQKRLKAGRTEVGGPAVLSGNCKAGAAPGVTGRSLVTSVITPLHHEELEAQEDEGICLRPSD